MKIQEAQRVVLETTATRDKAEALLEALRRARTESDRQMKTLGMTDMLREATGRSFYDNAIDSTRNMIDALTRCVRDAKRDFLERDPSLTAAEQRELDELDAEALGHEAPRHEPHVNSRTAASSVAPTAADATLPAYQSDGAAGLDLAACLDAPLTLAPGAIERVPCGFAMALPLGYEAQVRPRSGLAAKHGVTLPNAPGTIDSDYRGEVMVPLINLGAQPFTVEPGMRVAQMIIAPVSRAEIVETDDLDATDRGDGGFGSTGL